MSKSKTCASIVLCFLMSACSSSSSTSSIEDFTKYTDVKPVKNEERPLVSGERSNILTIYFSRSGNTDLSGNDLVSSASLTIQDDGTSLGNAEQVAEWIQEATHSDLVEIQTEYTYPLDYDQLVEVGEGQDEDQVLPALITRIPDLDRYDTIYLVYPVWHYTLPAPVRSFLDATDLKEKTIYCYGVNAGSGFADTIDVIRSYEPRANVVEKISIHQNDLPDSKQAILDSLPSTSIALQIDDQTFDVQLASTQAAQAFYNDLKNGPITVSLHSYGDFEQVGDLGKDYPQDDVSIEAAPGDLMLYNGNEISLFYGTNTWSYTPIGHVEPSNDWLSALQGDQKDVTFSIGS